MPRDTCIVTGGLGFVGAALVQQLVDSDWEVFVIDNFSVRKSGEVRPTEPSIQVVKGDVRDGSLLERVFHQVKPTAVFHLAAIHYIPACELDPAECISVNSSGTVAVLEACSRLQAPPACVLTSTGAVYAPASRPHAETSLLGPIDVYGLSKLWLEHAAGLYRSRRQLRVAVARLFNVYGPGETNPHLIPSLIGQALNGDTLQVGALATARDYVHVSDVARALRSMVSIANVDSLTCLNIGTGRATTGYEVVQAIEKCLGRELTVSVDPSRLRTVDRPLLLSDSQKAESVLGWRAQVEFEAGLCDLVNASVSAGILT